MQYMKREHALRALNKYTTERTELLPGEVMSPAEFALVSVLFYYYNEDANRRGEELRFLKHLKSIARCVGLFPIQKDVASLIEVRRKFSGINHFPISVSRGKRRVFKIHSALPIPKPSPVLEYQLPENNYGGFLVPRNIANDLVNKLAQKVGST